MKNKNNPEKLATMDTQEEEKQHKNTPPPSHRLWMYMSSGCQSALYISQLKKTTIQKKLATRGTQEEEK